MARISHQGHNIVAKWMCSQLDAKYSAIERVFMETHACVCVINPDANEVLSKFDVSGDVWPSTYLRMGLNLSVGFEDSRVCIIKSQNARVRKS